jgi:hypothetical protein
MQLTALAGLVANKVEPAKQNIKKLETFRRLAVDIFDRKNVLANHSTMGCKSGQATSRSENQDALSVAGPN